MMERAYFGNTVSDYVLSLSVLVVGMLLVWVFKAIILRRIKHHAMKTSNKLDDFLVHIIESKVLLIVFLGVFYISIQNLTLSPTIEKVVRIFGLTLLTLLGVRLLIAIVYYAFDNYFMMREDEELRKKNVRRLLPILKVFVWGIGLAFLLDNLGFKISTVVAGLGIGGIAVALAAQAVLGDLFSYISILLDRPFEIGDFIIVGDYMGTVEYVGIKTTRIRSLGGEQLVFSNSDLTGSRVRNYKRMEKRRIVFRFGVTYQTELEKLRSIPGIVAEIAGRIEEVVLDRVHFFEFGDFSLNYEVVYYVLSSDYNIYMDVQQRINLALNEEFATKGIEFAYPTQTIYMEKPSEG